MNRILRIAAATLSIAAAGSAMAESPFFTIEPAATTAATRASSAPRDVVRGVMHDYIESRSDAAPAVRSRTDVRAEALAALRSGELRQPPVAEDAFYPLHAAAAPIARKTELMAALGQ